MDNIQLTSDMFIAQFPEFAPKQLENEDGDCCCCPTEPIDPTIDTMIARALNYISPYSVICGNKKQYVVFLLTAHFLTLQNNIKNGETSGGLETSASIDKVSITITPPPFSDNFEYWLNQTTYGQQLLAFLYLQSAVPNLIGGSFQRVLR